MGEGALRVVSPQLPFHEPSAKTVAGRIFNGVPLASEEFGDDTVRTSLENADYPIDHFRGLVHDWLTQFGYEGLVEAKELGPRRYQCAA